MQRERRQLVPQHLQGPQRRDEIGEPERQAEAEQAPAVDEEQGQYDVQQVLAEVDDERRAGVLMRIEDAQHEQVDARSRPVRGRSRRALARC